MLALSFCGICATVFCYTLVPDPALPHRNAPPDVLHHAVEAALACTHLHPIGIDGAFIQAAAVAWLSLQPTPQSVPLSPKQQYELWGALLEHLVSLARTDEMGQKLAKLKERVNEWGACVMVGCCRTCEELMMHLMR